MINKICGGLNFTSNILYNRTLDKGFNQAKIDARTDKKNDANRFANAINYLKNDGKNDIYEVQTKNSGYESANKVYLIKNGEIICSGDWYNRLGKNVMHIINNYVKYDLNYNTDNPRVKKNYNAINNYFNVIDKNIINIKNELDENNELTDELSNIQKRLEEIHSITKERGKDYVSSELYVEKLNDVLGDVHYGEML